MSATSSENNDNKPVLFYEGKFIKSKFAEQNRNPEQNKEFSEGEFLQFSLKDAPPNSFVKILNKGQTTNIVKCQYPECDTYLQYWTSRNRVELNRLNAHWNTHQVAVVASHLLSAGRLEQLINEGDSTISFEPQNNVSSTSWINYAVVHHQGIHQDCVVCIKCYKVIKIEREQNAQKNIRTVFPDITLKRHTQECVKQEAQVKAHQYPFEGYLKLELTHSIEKGEVNENLKLDTVSTNSDYMSIKRRDGLGNFQNTKYFLCMICKEKGTVCLIKSVKDHSKTHVKEKVSKASTMKTAKKKILLSKIGTLPLKYQESGMQLIQLPRDLYSVKNENVDTSSSFRNLEKIIQNQRQLRVEMLSPNVEFLSSPPESEEEEKEDDIKAKLKEIKLDKLKIDSEHFVDPLLCPRTKIVIFRDRKNKKWTVLSICALSYNPENPAYPNTLPNPAITEILQSTLNYYRPKEENSDEYYKMTKVDPSYKPDWIIEYEQHESFATIERDVELTSFNLALVLQIFSKARVDRLLGRVNHNKIILVGPGSMLFLKGYHLESIKKWLDFFGVSLHNDSIEETDSEEEKKRKKNNIIRASMDFHDQPSKSFLCFNREHGPKNVEKKVIYLKVSIFNDCYLLYAGLDQTAGEKISAQVHATSHDLTMFGVLKKYLRDIMSTSTFSQTLTFFHDSSPDVKLLSAFEFEGLCQLAYLLGIITGLTINFKTPEFLEGFGQKNIILYNYQIRLPTAHIKTMELLLKQLICYIFKENVIINYNPGTDKTPAKLKALLK